MQLKPGTLLQGGKYRIVRFIKSGGFGCTYEVLHTVFGEHMVIKEFFPKDFCNRDSTTFHVTVGTQSKVALVAKLKSKFVDEAVAIHNLSHAGIVKVFDIFEENGTAYYVMDYIDGCSLEDVVRNEGPLSEQRSLSYIRQVCSALAYVHSCNRLHLDIKPGNIMIDGGGHAILIDFGTSKQYDEINGENTSTLLGITPGYAPLEQYRRGGVQKFYATTDIYALGATLYKLLTGQTPPDADEVNEEGLTGLPLSISVRTRAAVEKAMSPRRKDRPQSIDDFLALLVEPAVEAVDVSEDTEYYGGASTSLGIQQDTNGLQQPLQHKSGRILKYAFAVIICGIVLWLLLIKQDIGPDSLPVPPAPEFPSLLPEGSNIDIGKDETAVLPGELYKDYSRIEIGDYFYSDGSFSRGVIDSLKPVGVVFSLEVSENDRKRGWTNGYIMALSDAKRGRCKWGPANDIKEITNYSDNEDEMCSMMDDLNGYDYTYCSSLDSTINDAFYYARNYDASLPKNTSGWFLPSFGHWVRIIENLGKTDVYTKVVNKNNGLTRIFFNSSEALENLAEYGFKDDDYSVYWSSCEGPKFEGWKQDAWIIWFNNDPENDIYSLVKETSRMSIRTVSAF